MGGPDTGNRQGEPLKVSDQIRRRTTAEFGVVVSVEGEYATIVFADSGQALVHVDDVEPAPADPLARLERGELGDSHVARLRLQARYLQHAYRYDELSGLSNARIEPQLHQVFIAHRVSQKLRPRMILADEVGLGKTIEAGLIIKELIARQAADRILVICPASLQYQWQFELQSKFNEEFVIIDGTYAKILGRDGSNPWAKQDRVIASLSLARREDRAAQIIETPWDLVVFDEAHHVRRRWEGPGRFRTTQAYRLADELKEIVDGMLLLTATPMQLHPFELYSLVELVEPGLYPTYESYDTRRTDLPEINELMRDLQNWETYSSDRKHAAVSDNASMLARLGLDPRRAVHELDVSETRESAMDDLVTKHPLSQALVRNRKAIIGGFNRRSANRIPVTPTDDEVELYIDVTRYILVGYNRAIREKNNAVGFLMVLYQKLLASSSNALRASFLRRIAKLRDLIERAEEFTAGEMSNERLQELRAGEEASVAIDELEQIAINRAEIEWEIETLADLCDRLGKIRDSKGEKLIYDIVIPLLKKDPNGKILIFTGFIKTQEFLAYALRTAGYRVSEFNGQMKLEEKEASVREFKNRSQIMITTEAGGEGRNFQFAHIMINYDLPWNPMKVEQRIGRLDRIGQRKRVLIYNLAVEGTVEDHVLEILQKRIGLFTESVGSLDPILGEVERDLEKLVMEHADHLDERLDRYARELEERVEAARVKERVLADFTLDRASLRRDEAAELLERDPLATWKDLRTFTGECLEYFGGRLSEHTDGGDSVSFSRNLAARLGVKQAVTHGVFDPREALRLEDLPFLAFGHETIDRVIRYASEQDNTPAATRLSDAPNGWSVELIYEMESEGVKPSGRLVRHRIGPSGTVEVADLVALPPRGEPVAPPVLDWIGTAVAASRTAIREGQQTERRRVQAENERNKEAEVERAEQVYTYRKKRLQRVIGEGQAWIDEREDSPSKGEQRVLPARRGKLKKDRERLLGLRDEHEEALQRIRETTADVQVRVVAAGLVEGI